ncbi:unnamed protein product [Mycena citricolor]|uniref:Uncharacterized protein n=1 Tax=Mycena citricolor TaxID=2018698 RepID=A0AAD2H409_9AGAR|nr:unnamed protein product [Mycena citricolor]
MKTFTPILATLSGLCAVAAGTRDARRGPCSAGLSAGFVHNEFAYVAPLSRFTDLAGSFFHGEWFGGNDTTFTHTSGTDNVPGATRSGVFASDDPHLRYAANFTETLTHYAFRPGSFLHMSFRAVVSIGSLDAGTLHQDTYSETVRFESVCAGHATYITFLARTCAQSQSGAYDFAYGTHLAAALGLKATVGAAIMSGDCPVFTPYEDEECDGEDEQP